MIMVKLKMVETKEDRRNKDRHKWKRSRVIRLLSGAPLKKMFTVERKAARLLNIPDANGKQVTIFRVAKGAIPFVKEAVLVGEAEGAIGVDPPAAFSVGRGTMTIRMCRSQRKRELTIGLCCDGDVYRDAVAPGATFARELAE